MLNGIYVIAFAISMLCILAISKSIDDLKEEIENQNELLKKLIDIIESDK